MFGEEYKKEYKNIIRIIKVRETRRGHVTRMGEKRSVCRVLMGKPKEKRILGRPGMRWDNFMMNIRETE
jgi:hypothetical protein